MKHSLGRARTKRRFLRDRERQGYRGTIGDYNVMLLGRDLLQFEAGYRLGYSETKKVDGEEHVGGLCEAEATNAPTENMPESSHAEKAQGQQAPESKDSSITVLERAILLDPSIGSIIDISQSPPLH